MRLFLIVLAALLVCACSDPSVPPPPSQVDGGAGGSEGVGCADPSNDGLLCASAPPNLFGTCVNGACVCCVVQKDGGVAEPCPVCP